MPFEVPSSPKVYTKTYENFKGIDVTNDSTNVWYRRSPSGVNMLPDASGRPFKRKGWESVISAEDLRKEKNLYGIYTVQARQQFGVITIDHTKFVPFIKSISNPYKTATRQYGYDYSFRGSTEDGWEIYFKEEGSTGKTVAVNPTEIGITWTITPAELTGFSILIPELGTEEIIIQRCFYFELAGIDHIIIFSNTGVFKYAQNILTYFEGSDDVDCYSSYDRAFFFEGDGKSAFYIYGNYKIWRYEYENGFLFSLVDASIPTVLIGGDCNTGAGTFHEGYNLIGNKAAYQYYTNNTFAHFGSDNLVYTLDEDAVKTALAQEGEYTYTYTTSWSPSLPNGLVVDGTPQNGDFIKILYGKYVILPVNVSDASLCEVYVTLSNGTQFSKSLTVEASGNPTADSCVLHKDNTSRENKQAWVQFNSVYTHQDGTEDAIRIIVPITEVTITSYPSQQISTEVTGTASLIE